jgi:hypothetical protein
MKYLIEDIKYDFGDYLDALTESEYNDVIDHCPENLIIEAKDKKDILKALTEKTGWDVVGYKKAKPLATSKIRENLIRLTSDEKEHDRDFDRRAAEGKLIPDWVYHLNFHEAKKIIENNGYRLREKKV